jgi:DNA topoisomerase-1
MSDKLVIVESPAKAKTIEKYLGKGYTVIASIGHVRDLPKQESAIDIANNYLANYIVMPGKERVIADLRAAARKASAVYMATDPDREGEAIAWHIVESISVPRKIPVHRVTFTEITPNAVRAAMDHPRTIDMDLVNAQQARRIVDRLVGYGLSRVLWDRVRRGLSGGRVQSVAVRLVVEREREILAFVKQEYWSIEADLLKQKDNALPFHASLIEVDGKKIEKFYVADQAHAGRIVTDLQDAQWRVQSIERKDKKRNAPPPFITSTLQQEASRKLSFSAKKTMMVAQQLYEGIDIGGSEGAVGLITYMRTDSVNVAKEAQDEARAYISATYGNDAIPSKPNVYTTKSKGAQEAHEAIRPTLAARAPQDIRAKMNHDQARLYDLIWKRFIASQMAPAVFDAQTVDIAAGKTLPAETTTKAPYTFRATGSVLKVPGFLAVYNVSLDDGEVDEDKESRLPLLAIAEALRLHQLSPNQHFTEPPPRYSDATLIKELERLGIGRPSTYSTITATIVDRKYVEVTSGRYMPTTLGEKVNDLLVDDFDKIVDYPYTSRLEDRLDLVAEGHEKWLAVVDEYYKVFLSALASAGKERVDTMTNMPCPKCDAGMLMVKFGREGEFMGCTRYPDCSFTSDFVRSEGIITLKTIDTAPMPDVECPLCKGPMMVRRGRFGNFLACVGYPTCKGTQRLDKNGKPVAPPEPTGITCPKCEERELLKRKGAFGRPFYGCSGYPKCDYIVNDLAEVATYDPAVEAAKPPRRSAVAARANAAKNAAAAAKAPTKKRAASTTTAKRTTAKPATKSATKSAGTKKTSKTTAKPATKTAKVTTATGAKSAPRAAATSRTASTKTATPRVPRTRIADREIE